ncbi:FUSC family protein [Nocardia cyriacigeorgica]|uniref:FUSC family protein n=1 Tax=Nocardia cyriacigeorgica TaxID=135487 RepID=A0A6P1CWM0_9NOCA|nr:FUSC family protein [Nocardia cyriacigeorgica]NEW36197.1 FUSC family protein [Nocardia cyriacigeorgica]
MPTTRPRPRPLLRHLTTEIDHLPATRVFAGLAIPGLMLIAAGRTDLLIYAVFGSFTGMYGYAESPRHRLTHQVEASVLLVGGVAAGIALGRSHAPAWALVVAVAIFGGLASPLTDRLGLRPEGPFFGIFAFGAIAMVAGTQDDPALALAICAATAGLCVVVGYLDAIRQPRTDLYPAYPPRRHGTASLVQAGRYAVAIAVAGGIGLLLGVGHANWAMAGAAVPLVAADRKGGVQRGVHRVVGTFAGLAVTAPLLIPGPSATVLALAIIALLYPTELFMARHYAVALGFFTPLIMLMTELADPADPLTMLGDRAIDTLIGVAVGVAVALLIHQPAATPPVVATPICELAHTGAMTSDNDPWYYCLEHHRAEQGKNCWVGDRMGPYPDQATAEKALEIAQARNRIADAQDED